MKKLIIAVTLLLTLNACSQKQESPADSTATAAIDSVLDSVDATKAEKVVPELTFDQKIKIFIAKLKKHAGEWEWRDSYTGNDLTAFRTKIGRFDVTVFYFSDDGRMWLEIDGLAIYKGEADFKLIKILIKNVGGGRSIKAEFLLDEILKVSNKLEKDIK